jgi:3-hydroxy-3-methylglutaryl CoA synthase
LPSLHDIAVKHHCMIAVDESHSLGVVGSKGKGIEEHYGMEGAVNFKLGSLSTALGATGGYIASEKTLITFLRYSCRGYLYSSTLPPPNIRAALEGLKVLAADNNLATMVKKNATALSRALTSHGFSVAKRSNETGIIDVLLGGPEQWEAAKKFSVDCLSLNYLAPILDLPGEAPVLRITVCSSLTTAQLEHAAASLAQAAYENKLITKKPAKKVVPIDFSALVEEEKEKTKEEGETIAPLTFDATSHSASSARPEPIPLATLERGTPSQYDDKGLPSDVGILAFEVYTPETCLVTKDVCHDATSKGLSEGHLSSFSAEHEDAVSASMTAVERLLQRYNVSPADVGRLEVGCETPVDHSKSIKTFLMPLFAIEDNHDMEGVELRSGAAAGSIALLDTVAWVSSPAWDGRLGIVVAVDDWESKPTRSGCVAVAMLIGPGAPIKVEPSVYGAFVGDRSGIHSRPLGWPKAEPVETGNLRREQESFEETLLACRDEYIRRAKELDCKGKDGKLIAEHTFVALPGPDACPPLSAFEKLCKAEGEGNAAYKDKCAPCEAISNHIGYCGNAGVPLAILSASLRATEPCRLLAFAFGCGSTGVLFSVQINGSTGDGGKALQALLGSRKVLSPEAFVDIHQAKISHHRKFDWKPKSKPSTPGTYFMNYLRGNGSRTYERTSGPTVSAVQGLAFSRLPAKVTGTAHPLCRDAGIIACEAFAPARFTTLEDLERTDKCPGKYTKGLEMKNNAFCGDNEDAASAMINCITRLLKRQNVTWDQIGRLDIGTETPTDAVKPLAAYVAGKIGEQNNNSLPIIACDHTNACYANTAAVLSSIGWIESPLWNGKYSITVVADVSYAGVRYWAGYGCIALLLGPDANIILETRCSYHDHFWDFWKPEGWPTLFPIVDGPLSMQNYIHSMTVCQQTFRQKLGSADLLKYFDFWVFHTTTPNFLRKVSSSYYSNEIANGAEMSDERESFFNKRVDQTMLLLKEVGLLYSVAVWANFVSLLATAPPEELVGKRISLFSFGSGATASMLCWRCKNVPPKMDHVQQLVTDRTEVVAKDFLRVRQTYCNLLGKFDLHPTLGKEGVREGCYYVSKIDEYGGRTYEKCDGEDNSL